MKLQKIPRWTAAAAAALNAVAAEDAASLAREVDAGTSELWCVDDHSYLVTCVDTSSRELIVCCYVGRDVLAIADVLYRIARKQGLCAVRFFTRRPALARKLRARFPLQPYGYVYRCEVPPHVTQ
jgi:hypothetical protein